MVVALGADLDPGATPGLVEAGHEFYTLEGAFALRDVLSDFDGGRVVVGVTSTPFKCPPAPSETALLMHDYLSARGLRDRSEISLVMPLPLPIPPSPAASEALLDAFAQRNIGWYPNQVIRELDPTRKRRALRRRRRNALRPVPRCPDPSRARGRRRVGHDRRRMDPGQSRAPSRLRTQGCSPSETSPASGHPRPASSPSDRRPWPPIASSRSSEATPPPPSTTATACATSSSEHRRGGPRRSHVRSGQPPTGTYEAPSELLAAEKAEFGASRIQRWFDRAWTNVPAQT